MIALSASELLEVWESGIFEKPFQRALLMISAAFPEIASGDLLSLSMGQRDSLLLTLRKTIFGPRITGITNCEECEEHLEVAFDADEILKDLPADHSKIMELSIEDFKVLFRLPNSSDLLAASDCRDTDSFRYSLLKSCLTGISRGNEEASLEDLPEIVVDEIVARMEMSDPQADMHIILSCPLCKTEKKIAFDISSFLWSELNAWAVRTPREVHILASAYCWRETDILAMSPWRRQFYLEVLNK